MLADSIRLFYSEVGITSKTQKKEEKTDHQLHGKADGNNRKHRSITLDNEPSGHTEQEHITTTENDVHQKTGRYGGRYRKKSVSDQMNLIKFAHTSSLPTRVMNNVSPTYMVILQTVQRREKYLQNIKSNCHVE